MPRQIGVVNKERRIGILIFYRMRDEYFVRALSSLSSERVKKSKEFKNTMVYANRMAVASRLAATIYRQLPPGWKLHSLYRKLTGHAMQLLKEGMDATDILRKLPELLYQLGYSETIQYETIQPSIVKYERRKVKDKIRRKKTCDQRFRIRSDKQDTSHRRSFIQKNSLNKNYLPIPPMQIGKTRIPDPLLMIDS